MAPMTTGMLQFHVLHPAPLPCWRIRVMQAQKGNWVMRQVTDPLTPYRQAARMCVYVVRSTLLSVMMCRVVNDRHPGE